MPTVLQFRRGTEAQNNSYTGAAGELSIDTENATIRVHDGSTAGGSTIATEAYVDNAVGSLSADSISNGTSTLTVVASAGNIRANVGGSTVGLFTSSGLTVTGTISADSFAGLDATKIEDGTTNVSVDSSGGPVSVDIGGTNIINVTSGGITNGQADGVGNIGASGTSFNTVFAKATSAQYADLAEKYSADADYAPGTVVVVGGVAEVTACSKYADSSAAGVVSTAPAHLMNSGLDAQHTVDLALIGRVPCCVVGSISKGDLLTTSEIEGTATRLLPGSFVPGCIIGKSLEDYNSEEVGTIEILVGKV